MNNKDINALRARINRTRKTVDQIGRAAHAALLDLDDMSAMLDDMVSDNLWATKPTPTDERKPRKVKANDLGVTEVQMRHLEQFAKQLIANSPNIK